MFDIDPRRQLRLRILFATVLGGGAAVAISIIAGLFAADTKAGLFHRAKTTILGYFRCQFSLNVQ